MKRGGVGGAGGRVCVCRVDDFGAAAARSAPTDGAPTARSAVPFERDCVVWHSWTVMVMCFVCVPVCIA